VWADAGRLRQIFLLRYELPVHTAPSDGGSVRKRFRVPNDGYVQGRYVPHADHRPGNDVPGGLLKSRSARRVTRAPAWSHAALVGAVLCFGACGSHDEPPVLIDDLARKIADALCNNIGPCCNAAGIPHDPAQCHAVAKAKYLLKIEYSRFRPNIVYDADAARACVDAYETSAKACHDGPEIWRACRYVFAGTLRPGEACARDEECFPDAQCVLADSGGRECQWSPFASRGKLGDRCRWTCFQDGGATVCVAPPGGGSGTSCFTHEGLYCDRSTAVCAMAPGIGQSCDADVRCAGADAFCDNYVCANKRATGSCGSELDGCVATSYCELSAQQCTARKSTGAACTINNECRATDECTEGTCRPRTIASPSMCRGDL
jgi:hypothetical protein